MKVMNIVRKVGDEYGFITTFRRGIAIYMAHNSVNHDGKVHAASVVDMTKDDVKAESVRAAEELNIFIEKCHKY